MRRSTKGMVFVTGKGSGKDLTGQAFGRLTVIEFAGRTSGKKRKRLWLCRCVCGEERINLTDNLTCGRVKSCGCAMSQSIAATLRRHGHSGGMRGKASREYQSWQNMKSRCLNPTHDAYWRYGGMGITICKAWLDSFETFLRDMGARPPKTSIDRINPYGNYEPGNCRWADRRTQALNRRRRLTC